MDLIESLNMVRRIENLPEINDRLDKAIIYAVYEYYRELFELEELEGEFSTGTDLDFEKLDKHLKDKEVIHQKFWCNQSPFYEPNSISSTPQHSWKYVSDIEVMRNGDDENNLFIFKAKYDEPSHPVAAQRAYLLKAVGESFKIEHAFF
jgi:hypothetical protein